MSTLARGWAQDELLALERGGLLRALEPLTSRQGAVVEVGGARLINFSSNDYLGLCGDERLAQAADEAARTHGFGTGASRLIVGDSTWHRALEARLAAFKNAEAALLFNSGYAANVGVLTALAGPGDVVFSDELNHASIVDGCRLSRAQVVVYPHNDVGALEHLLEVHQGRRRLLCTDSVFSMDGDVAPLGELVELCQRRGVAVLVDEAHATGVLGPRGAGLCEALGLSPRVDVRVGTLSKALGAFGAYVLAAAPVRELLFNKARSLVFSTSLPVPVCAAALRAVDLVETDQPRRERLGRNVRRFAEGLFRLGLFEGRLAGVEHQRGAVFPVVVGSPERAVELSQRLRERGLLVKAIRPPTVPRGTSRLRFALSATHEGEHLDAALAALEDLKVRHAAA